mmetsp:Transcript_2191/g.4109  ORF Transcript_2191/g.4109 Transcript_2191/m.4109 type:complete len:211 (+) Transcript_2191:281-913(+)
MYSFDIYKMYCVLLTFLVFTPVIEGRTSTLVKVSYPRAPLSDKKTPTEEHITYSMSHDLIHNLLYTRKEAHDMDPEVAEFVISKRLRRPLHGMPREWVMRRHTLSNSPRHRILQLFKKENKKAIKVVSLLSVVPLSMFIMKFFNRAGSGAVLPLQSDRSPSNTGLPGRWRCRTRFQDSTRNSGIWNNRLAILKTGISPLIWGIVERRKSL